MSNRRVLFVDDEPKVIEGIRRTVRKPYELTTCTNPREALALVLSEPDFAVVVSDMRMPQMSGVEFLMAVKSAKPDTVRIMLTGNQDQKTAVAAVNDGDVFKFLNKPCDAASMTAVLEQAVRQYELVTAERELLTRTLQGSIRVLLEALSIAKPGVFGNVDRIERKCMELAAGLPGIVPWELRAAARLSQVGCIGVPTETIEKLGIGAVLTEGERDEISRHPQVGAELIREIPRLEGVADCILYQAKNFDGSGFPPDPRQGTDIPIGARVLRLVLALDQRQSRGVPDKEALAGIRASVGLFDPELIERLARLAEAPPLSTFRVTPGQLRAGHTIAEDVQNAKGILLVCRGQVVTAAIQRHLQHFQDLGTLRGPILVTGPAV